MIGETHGVRRERKCRSGGLVVGVGAVSAQAAPEEGPVGVHMQPGEDEQGSPPPGSRRTSPRGQGP